MWFGGKGVWGLGFFCLELDTLEAHVACLRFDKGSCMRTSNNQVTLYTPKALQCLLQGSQKKDRATPMFYPLHFRSRHAPFYDTLSSSGAHCLVHGPSVCTVILPLTPRMDVLDDSDASASLSLLDDEPAASLHPPDRDHHRVGSSLPVFANLAPFTAR